MKKLRIGIIGCGAIAMEKHLPALAQIPEVEIVAFTNTTRQKAEAAAAQFGTPNAIVYSTVDELLADPNLDGVHICTRNDTHAKFSIQALKAGKHVMCEKPMANSIEDARKMVEAARRSGKKLTIACNNRFREDSQYLKKACDRGDLGEIYYARALALRRRAVPGWLLASVEEQGGGPLLDIGTHALDLTLWLMDNFEPRSVVGTTYHKLGNRPGEANIWGPWDPDKLSVPESAFGYITMKNGATVLLESSWALNVRKPLEAKTQLCGTEGGADMADGLWINGTEFGEYYEKHITTERVLNFGNSDTDFTDRSKYGHAGYLEARCWIDSLLADTDPVVKPEQALVVFEILEAINESASTGKPVYFA
jgi:predicted dehydrogenase